MLETVVLLSISVETVMLFMKRTAFICNFINVLTLTIQEGCIKLVKS